MTTTTPQPTGDRTAATPIDTPELPQYSRRTIATVWAAAALPMGLLAWVVAPWLADRLDAPSQLPKALLLCLTAGLVWQFVLVATLVAREQRTLRWSRVRQALWLRAPISPGTGRTSRRLWLVVIPLIAAFAAKELLPHIDSPATRDLGAFLDSAAGHEFLNGAWGWFALIAVMFVCNTVLGEELLFRGLLLPRMNGAFGKRDWLANGLLFAAYHLHVPWAIPGTLLDPFILGYPTKRYRSALIGIAVHSAQSVVFLALALALVLGHGTS
ncbi:MAG: CPBP family intramembrane metalloprotease [Dactylosporangium sp.]|nr:CPBP family intramembrane metalloprotease [Dactylosporangium sp.]NNJ63858.1 CPBP family intramembrane metalloprotease [Dactylosporangium sp.]